MSHFRQVCECGVLVAQCRCPGPKRTTVVACTHAAPVEPAAAATPVASALGHSSPVATHFPTHFRCQRHDVVLPFAQYQPHCRMEHGGMLITVTPVWQQA